MKTISLCLLAALMAMAATVSAAEKDTRCYEMRIYYAAPGKLDALNTRFRDHTTKLFEKHGMVNIGYWVPLENPENKLIYILSYPSREARETAWKAFWVDPEWIAVQKASEKNGKLVNKADSILMTATDYSPAIQPSGADKSRCFELRTYTAGPGKLDALNARFRDHTVGLFKKHGLNQFGYWLPVDNNKEGGAKKLVYILAHESKESADANFKAFRDDSNWVAAKKASEVDGPLAVKVESVFMAPTDYSPTK